MIYIFKNKKINLVSSMWQAKTQSKHLHMQILVFQEKPALFKQASCLFASTLCKTSIWNFGQNFSNELDAISD